MINLSADNAVALIQLVNDKIDDVRKILNREGILDAQGAILRAEAHWVSQSEHSSKYFFSLEKCNMHNKTMVIAHNENGTIWINQEQILDIQAPYFKKLYSGDPNYTCKLKGKPEKEITEEERNLLEQEVTLQELQSAIKEMSRRKSSGSTGFSIDLYIVFWQKLKHLFLESVLYAFSQCLLHGSVREGLITLIPKKDCDHLWVKSWRPIVLLYSSYKIVSKVVANHIKAMLSNLIGCDQTAFIKGRQILGNYWM